MSDTFKSILIMVLKLVIGAAVGFYLQQLFPHADTSPHTIGPMVGGAAGAACPEAAAAKFFAGAASVALMMLGLLVLAFILISALMALLAPIGL